MGKTPLVNSFLYKYRYLLGYGAIVLLLIGLLLFSGLYVPGGLSDQELNSTVKSASLDITNPSSLTVTNLPYSLLQQAGFHIFGVSNFTIKLPSLIFAFVTSIGAVLLLRRWFKSNIAVLATTIMITTGQFLFVAQSGAAGITYIAWSVWLLLAATMITGSQRHRRFWKVVFFIIAGLSLYTPLSLYLLLAIASAALLHPHVRYVIRRMSMPHLTILSLLTIIIAAPLIYLITLRPALGPELLGLPTSWPPNLLENALTLSQQYLNFITPASGTLMTPVFGLGSIILIGLGGWQLFKTRYTARSYTVTAWTVLLLPILLINPNYTSVTFVPFLLLLASGLEYLLKSWYGLFPKNPYARIVGLIPLVILVAGLVFSGVGRYMYGYHYDPKTATSFTRDLILFNHHIKGEGETVIVVSNDEKEFYDAVAKYNKQGTIKVTTDTTSLSKDHNFAATRKGHEKVEDRKVSRIITTSHSNESDRFYIYK